MTENILTFLLIFPWIFIAYNFGYYRGTKYVLEEIDRIRGETE